ncbi:RNA methyltransferase, TrmH family [Promicromonospora umidemergens]|uniref:TrmH family RNA methyltransferase n=1 Tax=Promicromonospora umidemergens TaxID=629679 RepID=A0ABP8YGG2_9MICO|nr:TrmH family RNA methyltransferase [Promicromonospora umidemergens]MCP2286853.1 RNA methyltransferase, TrmH family [Promicromonospora umidemergens]
MATRISLRNARFQQLQTLLTNRNKRHRAGQFIVQGVRPITMAVEHGWEIQALLYDGERRLSQWARDLLAAHPHTEHVKMSPDLLAELAEKDEVELLAVVAMQPDVLDRIEAGPDFLGVVFDRPTQPGNIGAVIRSADAFGAHGVITTGHSADAYDPKAVRATTGSFFAMPVVRSPSPAEVVSWVEERRAAGLPIVVVATDEHGEADVSAFDLTQPVLLLVGSENDGLTRAWRDAADVTLSIPMTGSASSLNAANAATVVLYEARRQRLTK